MGLVTFFFPLFHCPKLQTLSQCHNVKVTRNHYVLSSDQVICLIALGVSVHVLVGSTSFTAVVIIVHNFFLQNKLVCYLYIISLLSRLGLGLGGGGLNSLQAGV